MGKQAAENPAGACKIGFRFVSEKFSPQGLSCSSWHALYPGPSLMMVQILIGVTLSLAPSSVVQGIAIFRIVNPLKLTTSQSQLLSSTDDRHPSFDGQAALFPT